MRRSVSLLVVSLLLFCGASFAADVDEEAVKARALGILGGEARIFIIPARSGITDGAFKLASMAKPSRMAKEISAYVSKAGQEELRVAFTGTKSAKTRLVVLQALSITEGDLPGLHATFFGESEDEARVKEALEAKKATYHNEKNPLPHLP